MGMGVVWVWVWVRVRVRVSVMDAGLEKEGVDQCSQRDWTGLQLVNFILLWGRGGQKSETDKVEEEE